MIARAYRLRTAADFNRTYKFGRSSNGDFLYIKYHPNNLDYSKLAVVASKKVSKRAVVRNRCKRRVVEIVRKEWGSVAPGQNMIITIKSDISKLDHSKVEASVNDCLKRAALLTTAKKD